MQQSIKAKPSSASPNAWLTMLGRVLISLLVPLVALLVLWQGFLFLRDSTAPKYVIALVAIVWGVGGIASLYIIANWLVEKLNDHWRQRILPFVFVGPAVAILAWYLDYPHLPHPLAQLTRPQ